MIVTALHYRSMAAEEPVLVTPSSFSGTASPTFNPSDYAARCLAIGIGQRCGQLIATVARATWFSHLRATAEGPSRKIMRIMSDPGTASLQTTPALHIASIALPTQPNPAQLRAACTIGHDLRGRGTFVIVTTASADPALPAVLGQACDCMLRGDGGMAHHSYPVRTVVEPTAGRLICYDLYDVCALWAGKIGAYRVLDRAAEAVHLELPTRVRTLQAADAVMTKFAAHLDQPAHLRLVTAGFGEEHRKGTPVSFTTTPYVRQERSIAQDRLDP